MFIDTYMVRKQAKIEPFTLDVSANELLNEIDERQGIKEPLIIKTAVIPYTKNHLWRIIQMTQRGIVVVDKIEQYSMYREKTLLSNLRTKQYYYNTFIFNFNITDEEYNNKDFDYLHEEIKKGNKMAIFAYKEA